MEGWESDYVQSGWTYPAGGGECGAVKRGGAGRQEAKAEVLPRFVTDSLGNLKGVTL